MKPFGEAPRDKVVPVSDPDNPNRYHFYLLRAVYIGSAETVGNMRIQPDGTDLVFPNLSTVGKYLLKNQGEVALAEQQPTRVRQKVSYSGQSLMEKNAWPAFCKLRGIDIRSINFDEKYSMTIDEAEELGLSKG